MPSSTITVDRGWSAPTETFARRVGTAPRARRGEEERTLEKDAARRRLAEIVRVLAAERRDLLDLLKAGFLELERPDFLWHALLRSFATMGRSAGYDGLIGDGCVSGTVRARRT